MSLPLTGCFMTLPEPSTIPDEETIYPSKMFLVPGDELEVSFLGAPDLAMTQHIRRDGYITLRLVGDVKAADKTPGDLQKEISQLYASQLQIKAVSVIVRSSAPVFVTGAVLSPGRLEMRHPLTVLEAVMEAGGFDPARAEVKDVVVIRHEKGQRRGYVFDFEDALRGVAAEKSFFLKPFDVVYVPLKESWTGVIGGSPTAVPVR
jgi:polysaccharide export outer membrane protein